MRYEVFYSAAARREITRIAVRHDRRRLLDAIDRLGTDPRPRGAKKLKTLSHLWRIRVGDYRVIYSIEDELAVVIALRAAHRARAYGADFAALEKRAAEIVGLRDWPSE